MNFIIAQEEKMNRDTVAAYYVRCFFFCNDTQGLGYFDVPRNEMNAGMLNLERFF